MIRYSSEPVATLKLMTGMFGLVAPYKRSQRNLKMADNESFFISCNFCASYSGINCWDMSKHYHDAGWTCLKWIRYIQVYIYIYIQTKGHKRTLAYIHTDAIIFTHTYTSPHIHAHTITHMDVCVLSLLYKSLLAALSAMLQHQYQQNVRVVIWTSVSHQYYRLWNDNEVLVSHKPSCCSR